MATNWVYIRTNKERGTFYTGSTSDPVMRDAEHKSGKGSKHVAKYNLNLTVYFKAYPDKETALAVEQRIKRKNRNYKVWLIEQTNPNWRNMCEDWFTEAARETD